MTEEIRESYRLLEVEPGAPIDVVKEAYRDLIKIWHPDRFPHDPKFQKRATEKTKALNAAYQNITAHLAGNYTESRASIRAAQRAARARAAEKRRASPKKTTRWAHYIGPASVVACLLLMQPQRDREKAFDRRKSTAEFGNVSARYSVGQRYDNGKLVQPDVLPSPSAEQLADARQGTLEQAHDLAVQFKAGNGQEPVALTIPEGDPRLKVNSISFGGKVPLAMINGKTLAEGESAKIFISPLLLRIKCLKIEKEAVRIAVEGEDAARVLRFR